MKKTQFLLLRLVLLLFFISGLKAASAQTWPMPGAKWKYCIFAPGPVGFNTMEYTRDTLIQGKTYNIIEHTDVDNGGILYTRYSNDTVYRWVKGKEYLYFTYNLEVGDLYTTYRSKGINLFSWSDTACSSKLPLKVTEKKLVEYGDKTLRQWTLYDTLYNDLYPTTEGNINKFILVERIGVINSLPLINPMEYDFDEIDEECYLSAEGNSYSVGLYQDNSFNYLFEECEGSSIDEHANYNKWIKLYPNPATEILEIEINKSDLGLLKVKFLNMAGEIVKSVDINTTNNQIDISYLDPGCYFVKIITTNTYINILNKKIIIN